MPFRRQDRTSRPFSFRRLAERLGVRGSLRSERAGTPARAMASVCEFDYAYYVCLADRRRCEARM